MTQWCNDYEVVEGYRIQNEEGVIRQPEIDEEVLAEELDTPPTRV